jgi:TonB family protein
MKRTLLLCMTSSACLFADQISDARAAMNRGELVNAEQILNAAIEAAQHAKKSSALDLPLDLLAQVYQREKKFPEAVAVEQRRIDMWTGLLGENAVVVARVLSQMSAMERYAGNLPDAESHSRRALAILMAAYTDKPASAQAAVDMADILLAENRKDEAEQILALAEKIYETSLGPASPLTIGVAARLKQPVIAAATPSAYRIGGQVSAPRILSKVEPQYSEEARKGKLQGTILLSVVIDATGTPTQIAVLRPLGMGLDEAAIAAVSQWKFAPGTKGGTAVPVISQIETTFHLL